VPTTRHHGTRSPPRFIPCGSAQPVENLVDFDLIQMEDGVPRHVPRSFLRNSFSVHSKSAIFLSAVVISAGAPPLSCVLMLSSARATFAPKFQIVLRRGQNVSRTSRLKISGCFHAAK
jgi:hypothetical protein